MKIRIGILSDNRQPDADYTCFPLSCHPPACPNSSENGIHRPSSAYNGRAAGLLSVPVAGWLRSSAFQYPWVKRFEDRTRRLTLFIGKASDKIQSLLGSR